MAIKIPKEVIEEFEKQLDEDTEKFLLRAEAALRGMKDKDSYEVHKETFDAEDELFKALDDLFGSNNVDKS